MHSQDGAIDRLHRQFGDDADGRGDYLLAEEERYKALDTLTDVRSKTLYGMAAKAEALTERSLIEDYGRHGQIATSLATDLLRYLGKVA
jgi:hypothetical protein